MKQLTLSFFIATGLALTQSACTTTTGSASVTKSTPANQVNTLRWEGRTFTLLTSEQTGLAIYDKDNKVVSIPGRFSQSDWRWINDTLFVAALDTNTTDLVGWQISLDTHTVEEVARYHVNSADQEAVCLYQHDNRVDAFIADARGMLSQVILQSDATDSPVAIRTLTTGTGIKACAVHDSSDTLYLADENAGIWQYSAWQEAESDRTLLFHLPETAIEGVAVTSDGYVWWASPDKPVLWQQHPDGKVHTYTLPQDLNIEGITADRVNTEIVTGLYDDNSQRTVIRSFTVPEAVSAASSDNQADTHLTPVAQTSPVSRVGDAADDPAIWVNSHHPQQSLILGTDKKAGLYAYSLNGEQQQFLPVGRLNNVDVRYHFPLSGQKIDIAVASNRSDNSLSVFSIEPPSGQLALAASIPTGLKDVYGLCMANIDNRFFVIVNDTDGRFEQYELSDTDGVITGMLVNQFTTATQPEGCVVDDATGILYYGEEGRGIWQRSLLSPSAAQQIASVNDPGIAADIEGLALFTVDDISYLLASSQGNHRYAVYTVNQPRLLGTFDITENIEAGIDGASETDGLEATSQALGKRFPNGLLVVQDGHNVMPSANQNFKLVDGTALAEAIQYLVTSGSQ